jgi:hypothetical protein
MSISRLWEDCQSDSIAARQAVLKHCPLHNRVEFPILNKAKAMLKAVALAESFQRAD